MPTPRASLTAVLLGSLVAEFSLVRPPGSVPAPHRAQDSVRSAPADTAHGLRGRYYTVHLREDWPDYAGVQFDEHHLPQPMKPPDAERIDSQLSFASGHWWPHDPKRLADGPSAAVWSGYIRFPKAGTYYLTTASRASSAVFINSARVALNGGLGGGTIPSDAFTYPSNDVAPDPNSPSVAYVVPITITKRRSFPIEVRLTARKGFGILLYWVTPDSPRDSAGKPVAELVPAEALYLNAPSDVEQSRISSAHSTISADFLDFPFEADTFATLTIRVADVNGNPVKGQRVRVSGLVSYGPSDSITQPTLSTDKNGLTTASVRRGSGFTPGHTSRFFATAIDDLVDVDQVAEMEFDRISGMSFLPDAYSSYYGSYFRVEPTPMRVGQPVTVTVPLTNRQSVRYELSIEVLNNAPNIGLSDWRKIGRSESVILEPGETKLLSVTWTPKEEAGHVCFKVIVWGAEASKAGAAAPTLNLASVFALPRSPEQGVQRPLDIRQQNIGSVSPPWGCGLPKSYWLGVKSRAWWLLSLAGVPTIGLGGWDFVNEWKAILRVRRPTLLDYGVLKPGLKYSGRQVLTIWSGTVLIIAGIGWLEASYCAKDPPDNNYKNVLVPVEFLLESTESSRPAEPVSLAVGAHLAQELTVLSWLHATITSLERYQGAIAAGDKESAERQLAAYMTYVSQLPRQYDHAADLIDQMATVLRVAGKPDVPLTDELIAAGQKQLLNSRTDQTVKTLLGALAIPDSALEAIVPPLISSEITNAPKTLYGIFKDRAEFYRRDDTSPNDNGLRNIFLIANPGDRAATVDLTIRRGAIPPDWKLAIVNTEDSSIEARAVPIREVERGKHYQVNLPAGGQLHVASVLTPTGQVTASAVARWAVEGRIGNELIGGMVNELNVPALVEESMERAPVPANSGIGRMGLLLAAVLTTLMLFVLGAIRRRWKLARR